MIAISPDITLKRQCELLDVPRSTLYYQPVVCEAKEATLKTITDAMDTLYTAHPTLGRRGMSDALAEQYDLIVNPKKTRRLMKVLGLEAIYPRKKRNLSAPDKQHKKYPYLLKNMDITRADQVWCSDITYIRVKHGFCYLCAVMDWHSRYVLSWRISNTLESSFCVEALQEAIDIYGVPEIFNTDQGSQYTSEAFTGELIKHGIQISMDGAGRAYDNIMIERLWRSVKYEDIYLKDYENPREVNGGLRDYFAYYNHQRRHSSLGKQTPARAYGSMAVAQSPFPLRKNLALTASCQL